MRGPIATRYTQQFLRQVAWDNLDYLILDLPPGTGDIQLTIVQQAKLDADQAEQDAVGSKRERDRKAEQQEQDHGRNH